MAQYAFIASRLVAAAYALSSGEALTMRELLEKLGTDEYQEQVLVDDDAKCRARLDRLTHAVRHTLEVHDGRRIKAPLAESQIAPGSFSFAFADSLSLDDNERRLRAAFRLLPAMLEVLQSLPPEEFEALCSRLLREMGCINVTTTQAQRDDGVDVIAELPMTSGIRLDSQSGFPLLYRVAGSLSFLVYGQAKRYGPGNPVKQEAVLELEGSWRSVRNAFFRGTLARERSEALKLADYRPADPVLLLLLTTSTLTRGAHTKAEDLGIIALDGEQIAQLMLEARLGVEELSVASCQTSVEHVLALLVS